MYCELIAKACSSPTTFVSVIDIKERQSLKKQMSVWHCTWSHGGAGESLRDSSKMVRSYTGLLGDPGSI